ncbi:MAG TPA: hypothetical protein VKA95_11905 [Nitrososphaeraceae archaeon]|nr:hypothetical protein [Nitrososphaeraceae archaeon]
MVAILTASTLAGSIGNDAQALPSASRAPNLCAKCLFAVHYLPLGVILVNGKLAVFQSTSKNFWYALVNTIAIEIKVDKVCKSSHPVKITKFIQR